MALALPLAPAAAQASDCAALKLLATPGADLSALDLRLRSDGRIDITAGSKDDLLAGATKCDLVGPADQFQLGCQWQTEAEAEARTHFTQLKAKIGQCLKGDFSADPEPYDSDSMKVLASYKGTVGADEDGYGGADINLQLVRYDFGDGDIAWWVSLDTSH